MESSALDQDRGPHAGGCGTCSPLVTVSRPAGTISYAIDFYTLGHFSKFVLPGALRIFSSNGPGIITSAFKNPDASKALVAVNESAWSRTIEVKWGTQSLSFTLPGLTGATFTWTGVQNGTSSIDPTRPIQASSFHSVSGLQTEVCSDTLSGFSLGYAEGGDYAIYKKVDFGARDISGVDVRVASAGAGGGVSGNSYLMGVRLSTPLTGKVPRKLKASRLLHPARTHPALAPAGRRCRGTDTRE